MASGSLRLSQNCLTLRALQQSAVRFVQNLGKLRHSASGDDNDLPLRQVERDDSESPSRMVRPSRHLGLRARQALAFPSAGIGQPGRPLRADCDDRYSGAIALHSGTEIAISVRRRISAVRVIGISYRHSSRRTPWPSMSPRSGWRLSIRGSSTICRWRYSAGRKAWS